MYRRTQTTHDIHIKTHTKYHERVSLINWKPLYIVLYVVIQYLLQTVSILAGLTGKCLCIRFNRMAPARGSPDPPTP